MITKPAPRAGLLLCALAVAGCGAVAALRPASAPPHATPGPVSTAVTISGDCVPGYEMVQGSTASGVFLTGTVPPPASGYADPDPALAYRVTLTNTSQQATADINGFAVAFSDSSGSQAGSDRQDFTDSFILPGQSLTWTVLQDATVSGYGDNGQEFGLQSSAIPPGAASCQIVAWYHPVSLT